MSRKVKISGEVTILNPQQIRSIDIDKYIEDKEVVFDLKEVTKFDSLLVSHIRFSKKRLAKQGVRLKVKNAPDGVLDLLELSFKTAGDEDEPQDKGSNILENVGLWYYGAYEGFKEFAEFIGNVSLSLKDFFTLKESFRLKDLISVIASAGPSAVPIITLISFLSGMILAFVGSVQLEMFGAQIYVANLVGLGMAREMGALMTGVIMAGRTGSAFAAELASQKTSQELDALEVTGINPITFLVLPRLIGLIICMPLLCLYADAMGIVGGAIYAVVFSDIDPIMYIQQTAFATNLMSFVTGVIKCFFYGVIVSICGCQRGIYAKKSAEGVGEAATSAVVISLVFIVVADFILTLMFNFYDI